MREVTRLADDVMLFWRALPAGLSLRDWRRMPMGKREHLVVAETKSRMPSLAQRLEPPQALEGAEWWLYAHGIARQFTTETGDMEPGDVWEGENEVFWKDETGDYNEVAKDRVVIERDASNIIQEVRRR